MTAAAIVSSRSCADRLSCFYPNSPHATLTFVSYQKRLDCPGHHLLTRMSLSAALSIRTPQLSDLRGSKPLLKQPAQQSAFSHQDHQQIDRARQEAEALFRPQSKLVNPATPRSGSVDASQRKPRILRATAPPPGTEIAGASIRRERQAAFSLLQLAQADRHRLSRAREAILRQQQELQARLEAIDAELRAIAACETAR